MKKFKKLLSVILVATMVFTTFSIGITASAESSTTETGTTADSPLEVVVTTNESDYGKFDVAEITVTVTNTSDETVANISAEAVFDDLAPCKQDSSETSKEVETLNPGESFSFSYKATLSLDNPDVGFFSKIILWFARLFNGGYTANENNFDNGREYISKTDVISFGNVSANNEIKVWYEYNIYTEMYNNPTKDNEVKELENGLKYVENELLIGTVEGTTEQEVEDIIKPYNGVIVGHIAFSGDYQIKFPNIKNIEELEKIKNNIKSSHIITYAILNYVDEITPQTTSYNPYENYIPSDPYNGDNWNAFTPWGSNWGVEAVGALQAWTKREELRTINIGIIDSMFDVNHQDLSFAEVWNNPDNVSELYLSDKTNDSFYHGTHVAGIFASRFDNGIGISGVYPNNNANLYAYAMHGTSSYSGLMDWKIALGKMIVNNVKVINISLGYNANCEQASKGNQDVIQALDLASENLSDYLKNFLSSGFDFVICHSAGNGNNDPSYDSLAQYSSYLTNIKDKEIKDRIIVVGSAYMSIIPMYSITSYSNVGDRVDIMAPGENIYSTMPNNEYASIGGTSMASPIVAGTAAMIWGANSTLSGADIKWIIENSTTETVSGTEKELVDAGVSINVALNVTGNGENQNQNKGQFIVEVKNAETNELIPNAWVSITSIDNTILYCHEQTDVLGEFSTLLPRGKYNVSIYHSDYTEVNDFIIEISNNQVTNESILLTPKSINYTLSGTVKDKTTSDTISEVKVSAIIPGGGSTTPVATTSTDENGNFSLSLPNGTYALIFTHNDYENYGWQVTVNNGDVTLSEPVLLTPKSSSSGEYQNISSGDIITVSGTLKTEDYEINSNNKGTVYILNLEQPINAKLYDDSMGYDGTIETISSIQINDSSLSSLVGENITVTGTVMFGHTAHHLRTIVLTDCNISSRTIIDSGSCGADGDNVTWTLYDDGELVISGSGAMKDYVGNTETPWYDNRTIIKLIDINNGVTSIGSQAFFNCNALTNVRIPNTVTNIGDAAFYDCFSLTNLTLSNKVTNIGDYAFYMCGGLSNINFPNTITHIGNGAFNNCVNLETVTIPDSVKSIGDEAFRSCDNLETVTIPYSVINIGYYAFGMCDSLIKITVDNSNLYYSSDSYGVLYNKDKTELITYPIGNPRKSFGVPEGVIKIHEGAFRNCQNLTSVTIPQSVVNIQRDAFYICEGLSSITVDSDNLYYSSDSYGVLYNKNKTELIQYPIGNTRKSYTIPNSVLNIGYSSFSFCKNLTSITIPKNVANIEIIAFLECINLADVYYTGTEAQWNNITIDTYNSDLLNATIHYNS